MPIAVRYNRFNAKSTLMHKKRSTRTCNVVNQIVTTIRHYKNCCIKNTFTHIHAVFNPENQPAVHHRVIHQFLDDKRIACYRYSRFVGSGDKNCGLFVRNLQR